MQRKAGDLEIMVSGHCTILRKHIISMRTSYFDTDFASKMKLTKLSLIHCLQSTSIGTKKKETTNTWQYKFGNSVIIANLMCLQKAQMMQLSSVPGLIKLHAKTLDIFDILKYFSLDSD